MSVFWAGEIKRLLQDLGLHRLAAKQSLKVANPLFEFAKPTRADHIFIGLDGGLSALHHALPPAKQLRRSDAGLPGDQGHR